MGRNSKIELLPAEEQSKVHEIIRAHRYLILDNILEDIKALGIRGVSRSALGRYVPRLKAQDFIKAAPDEGTVVTIVERSTGKVLVVTTAAAADLVAEKINGIRPVSGIS